MDLLQRVHVHVLVLWVHLDLLPLTLLLLAGEQRNGNVASLRLLLRLSLSVAIALPGRMLLLYGHCDRFFGNSDVRSCRRLIFGRFGIIAGLPEDT